MSFDLHEFWRLAGATDAHQYEAKERPGTKMVFGKLRKLKKGFQKSADKSDRTMDKALKVGDKIADIAAKRGGMFGKAGASLYHQQKAATHAGRAIRNRALGQKGKAATQMKKAGGSLKLGLKLGLRAAASVK